MKWTGNWACRRKGELKLKGEDELLMKLSALILVPSIFCDGTDVCNEWQAPG
jgi:hypothetical protein